MSKYTDKINTIKEAYEMGCIKLSNYESEFLDSIEIRLSSNIELTWKQVKFLNSIYEKV